MRILLSGTPAVGHLVPLMPLAEAATDAGHEVAVLSSTSMAELVAPYTLLPGGPGLDVVLAEASRRNDGADPLVWQGYATPAETFGASRVDLSIDEALASARAFAPDLIIAEVTDYVGPLVAALLDVPWASHALGLALPDELVAAMDGAAASRFAERGVSPTAPLAYVDPCPPSLQSPGWVPPANRVGIRPRAHRQVGATWTAAAFPGRETQPRILVTLGTTLTDSEVLAAILRDLTDDVSPVDVNMVVTYPRETDIEHLAVDRSRVQPVSFVPFDRLLDGVAAVVSNGGAGSLFGTLSQGIPAVILPMGLDQPWNAARAAAAGAAIVVDGPGEVATALSRLLAEPSYRAAAMTVRADIEAMDSPEAVLATLIDRS